MGLSLKERNFFCSVFYFFVAVDPQKKNFFLRLPLLSLLEIKTNHIKINLESLRKYRKREIVFSFHINVVNSVMS